MITKLKEYFILEFLVLFFISFTFTLVNILFRSTQYHYNTLILIPLVTVSFCLLVFIYTLLSKYEAYLNQHYKVVLTCFLTTMMILQIFFGVLLSIKPIGDIGAIYHGAISWTHTGSFSNVYDYFYSFPHNLGSMTLLHFFFSISSFFGLKDYILVSTILTSILMISTMLVVFLTCKRLLGVKPAVFSLVLFAVSLPFYFIAPVFYTDSLSMLFPVLFYYIYLRWKDASNFKNSFLLCGLMGIVASVGMLIKFTVFIIVIAVMIDMLININIKKMIFANIVIYLCIFLCYTIFNAYIYSNHLDREQARLRNDPYTHWIMMGLKDSGMCNSEDYNFTRSIKDPDERRKANIEEIKRRVKAYGFRGMLELFARKSEICFGDGTYGLGEFHNDRSKERNVLHKYLTPEGEKYNIYKHICEAVFFAIMILMICSAFQYISIEVDKMKYIVIAPPLSVFGVYIFLLCWETNGRYFSNFLPLIFICSTLGIDYFYSGTKHFIKSLKKCDQPYIKK